MNEDAQTKRSEFLPSEDPIWERPSIEARKALVVKKTALRRIRRLVCRLEPVDKASTAAWGFYGLGGGAALSFFLYQFGDEDPRKMVSGVLVTVTILCLAFGFYLQKKTEATVKKFEDDRAEIAKQIDEEMMSEPVEVTTSDRHE